MAKKKAAVSSKKARKGCDCAKTVNEELAKNGMRLDGSLMLDFKTGRSSYASPLVAVAWKDKPVRRKRLPVILCKFCPFCGEELPET